MIENILPTGIESAELFSDPPNLQPHPLEAELIARAVDKRRREFMGARHCAREAMRQLGVEPGPVLRGDSGMPVFPRGVVGSLTHCAGYRGAALGHSMQFRSVGIDAEPHGPLPDGVLEAVSLAAERDWLGTMPDRDIHSDRLLFCAKEATYKAWFPLTKRWLGFEDAHITFTTDTETVPDALRSGRFRSEILIDPLALDGSRLVAFDGRWQVRDGLVLTAIVVS
ncbi:4'-phosphopantetheinyl transferase superfamily protein [Skermania sp. ID1734]|uniref:4'-phosphopantetheinyl transferase family protein n=1 Tax=Skermania sp. ID1734 TaxID=2597516 RepID=UPI00117CCADA|nr:4'-phosphopantetheinyl transferase superfamily protein [Skermania sp. ID1734]TSD96102.1 4'-phosphopantetheinyl transferase superfamily protein [Skermania sp. ID1734]